MAFDKTGLGEYVAGKANPIVKDMVLAGQSFDLIRTITGVKKAERVQDIQEGTLNYVAEADRHSATRFSGGVKMKEVDVETVKLNVSQSYTSDGLEGTIAQGALKLGTNPTDLPFKDYIMILVGNGMTRDNEKRIWRGNKATGGARNEFDGIETILLADDTVKGTGTAGIPLTPENALSEVDKVAIGYASDLEEIADELAIMVFSPKNFDVWYRAKFGLNGVITGDNLNTGKPVDRIMIPGTDIMAVSLNGMKGSDNLIVGRPDNFLVITDLVSDKDRIEMEYSGLLTKEYLLDVDYKLGAAIARPEEVYMTKVIA